MPLHECKSPWNDDADEVEVELAKVIVSTPGKRPTMFCLTPDRLCIVVREGEDSQMYTNIREAFDETLGGNLDMLCIHGDVRTEALLRVARAFIKPTSEHFHVINHDIYRMDEGVLKAVPAGRLQSIQGPSSSRNLN